MSVTEAINWDFIIEKIEEESAVLILGPQVLTTATGDLAWQGLIDKIDPSNNEKILRYYPHDRFFLFEEGQNRTLLCHDIKRYYNELPISPMLEKILDIPFHIILNINPDRILQKALHKRGFAYNELYYKKNKTSTTYKKPTAKRPLIYNVFGSVESEESMVLTHDDLYDYFKSILSGKSMPNKLKLKLLESKNFIFLGLEFDQWYMQLLLREFEIHNQKYKFVHYAANQGKNAELEVFCTEQFRINFISNNLEEFVTTLHSEIAKKGLIRKEEESMDTEVQKIKVCIREGNIQEALDLFLELTDSTELEDDATLIAGRYNKFKIRARRGRLTEDQSVAREEEISGNLLALLNKV